MTTISKPGVYDIPDKEYHADPCPVPSLSSTLARTLLNQSPLHAWTKHPRLNPDHEPEEKRTFDIGRVHQVLEINRIFISPDDSERCAFAELDGCWIRAMIDNAPPDPKAPLYDFKTCESADPNACMRAVMNYGYDVQAAHYLEVWEAATGEKRRFRFIFQEKSAPFAASVIELHPDVLTMARKRTARAREIWRNCVRSNHWPGYPPGVHVVDMPSFYQEKWLERESVEADYRQRTGRDVLDFASRWQSPEGVTQ